MLKAITHFDQIPISAVVEIMEREMRKKAVEVAVDAEEKFAGERAGNQRGQSVRIHSPVDIFRVDTKGVLWLESSASLDEAKARIQQLGAETSGEYVMLNQATGIKVVVKVDGASAA